jgi:hypothetical protein
LVGLHVLLIIVLTHIILSFLRSTVIRLFALYASCSEMLGKSRGNAGVIKA